MSIEMMSEKLGVTTDNCAVTVRAILDSDVIVPDSKPDAVKILQLDASAQVGEKYISKNYITITGTMNYKILYLGDGENGVHLIDYSAPFSQQIDARGADESMVCFVKCNVGHIEHSIKNSRKLNIKAAIDIDSRAYDMSMVSVITDINSDISLPYKEETINNFNLSICAENTFGIEECITVCDASPNIDELLNYSMRITNSELKVVLNKVVAKGNILFLTTYKKDGEIYTCENEIPFTQIADVETLNPEMYVVPEYDIRNTACSICHDEEKLLLDVKADIIMTVMAYEEKEVTYICDVYSPDYELEVTKERISVCEMVDSVTGQCVINDKISFGNDFDIGKIYFLTSDVSVSSSDAINNSVVVGGSVNVNVVGKSTPDSGKISCAYKEIPFTYNMPVSRDFKADIASVRTNATVEHQSYNIEGSSNVSLRLVVKINSMVTENFSIDAVTHISYDEQNRTDKSAQSGITVYFVQTDDDIWNIAKRYHTTEDEILSVNRLDEGVILTPGQQLLIPKRGK